MTSTDPIAVVRALLASVGENDVEGALDLISADLVFVDVLAPLEQTVRDVRGPEGMRQWFDGLHEEGVKRVSAEPFDLQDLGDGRVVGAVRVTQEHGVGSFVMLVYGLWELVDGKVARIHSYFDRDLAMRDAGLVEGAGLRRRWCEGVVRAKVVDSRAVILETPEFQGNRFSVAGEDLWSEVEVGAFGLAETEHGQLLSWRPFDRDLDTRPR